MIKGDDALIEISPFEARWDEQKLRDHTIEVSRDFAVGVPLILSHHPAKFGVHSPCVRECVIFLFVM